MKITPSSSLFIATLAISSSSPSLAAPASDASQGDGGMTSSPSNGAIPALQAKVDAADASGSAVQGLLGNVCQLLTSAGLEGLVDGTLCTSSSSSDQPTAELFKSNHLSAIQPATSQGSKDVATGSVEAIGDNIFVAPQGKRQEPLDESLPMSGSSVSSSMPHDNTSSAAPTPSQVMSARTDEEPNSLTSSTISSQTSSTAMPTESPKISAPPPNTPAMPEKLPASPRGLPAPAVSDKLPIPAGLDPTALIPVNPALIPAGPPSLPIDPGALPIPLQGLPASPATAPSGQGAAPGTPAGLPALPVSGVPVLSGAQGVISSVKPPV